MPKGEAYDRFVDYLGQFDLDPKRIADDADGFGYRLMGTSEYLDWPDGLNYNHLRTLRREWYCSEGP